MYHWHLNRNFCTRKFDFFDPFLSQILSTKYELLTNHLLEEEERVLLRMYLFIFGNTDNNTTRSSQRVCKVGVRFFLGERRISLAYAFPSYILKKNTCFVGYCNFKLALNLKNLKKVGDPMIRLKVWKSYQLLKK